MEWLCKHQHSALTGCWRGLDVSHLLGCQGQSSALRGKPRMAFTGIFSIVEVSSVFVQRAWWVCVNVHFVKSRKQTMLCCARGMVFWHMPTAWVGGGCTNSSTEKLQKTPGTVPKTPQGMLQKPPTTTAKIHPKLCKAAGS
mmetsp:Transcript_90754/g.157378  ORF Transcript_90754/g.157378 Transcript_90754/m.157378 type:complete len:141 (-) Transcript_90754:210-632(-)